MFNQHVTTQNLIRSQNKKNYVGNTDDFRLNKLFKNLNFRE